MQIDLLSYTKTRRPWAFRYLGDRYSWRVLSGKWKWIPGQGGVYLHDTKARFNESISIFGPRHWSDVSLKLRFRFLSGSLKPPEGGAIIYFLFQNLKNFYSYHLCIHKKAVEFVKRCGGIWNTGGCEDYPFSPHQDYLVEIDSRSGNHTCCINGEPCLKIEDRSILQGCIGIGTKYCDIALNQFMLSS